MLTGEAIKQAVRIGTIEIEPFVPEHVGANSVDVRLAPTLYKLTDAALDMRKKYKYETIQIPEEGYVLEALTPYLGVTMERTHTPRHIPEYNGKSTTGRYFLFSHVTAGFGDVGFNGYWTLEIVAIKPIRIYAGMRIGQVHFAEPVGKLSSYPGGYSNTRCLPRPGRPANI